MLKEYARKRRFNLTPEPAPPEDEASPEPVRQATAQDALTFVVQKHAATRLHYDLRLELDGVLVSWAVPKGPSLNPEDRRMAVKVEDHPLDYGGFEGSIPQGQYGGGEVIIWDRGAYYTDKAPRDRPTQEAELRRQLADGKVEIVLEGEKLRGGFVLIHTREKQWLLIKRQDEFASTKDVLLQDRSVVTERRIGGVAPASKKLPDLRPMLLTEAPKPFTSPEWSFELKLDGVRVLTYLESGEVRMTTRNGIEATAKLPRICRELEPLSDRQCILDGEIVVFDEKGLPTFQGLMEGFQAGKADRAVLCLFDILFLDGDDLRSRSWRERRETLEKLAPSGPHLRLLDTFPTDGELLYEQVTKLGFEGIVGKKIDSRYEAGVRSKNWVKIKQYHSEEFVVGGYAPGNGARAKTFGALLIGEMTDKGLVYVGNVGGGFDDALLEELKTDLDARKQKECPFTELPPIKGAVWVKPELVAEVRFLNRTRDGKLRFPIFLHLRPDLSPEAMGPNVPSPLAPSPARGGGSGWGHERGKGQGPGGGEGRVRAEPRKENSPDEEEDPFETKQPEPKSKASSDDVETVLSALATLKNDLHVAVEGHELHFTSLDKEMWPGVTKRDLISYYATVSDTLLLYLRDRPISFVRCPEGIHGQRFFQKHWDKGRPKFVQVVSIHSDSNEGARDYVLCNNLATLLSFGQLATLELNPWNSRVVPDPGAPASDTNFASSRETLEDSVLNRPDYLVFDLDPHFGGKATGWRRPEWELLVEVALELKEILAGIGLRCYPKSSGKSGLHLFVPLIREYTYDQIRSAGFVLGEQAVRRLGKKVTLEYNVRKRPDGVFIDVNQNVRGKTMAAPYSPRASEGAGVSMPLLWSEMPRVDPTQFTVLTAPDRLRKKGDLWREMLEDRQRLVVG